MVTGQYTRKQVNDAVSQISRERGIDPRYMQRLSTAESGGKDDARSDKGAVGRYQFIRSTWLNTIRKHGAKYGIDTNNLSRRDLLALRTDPMINSLMAIELTAENRATLMRTLGREPTYAELHFMHFQGKAPRIVKAAESNPNRSIKDFYSEEEWNDMVYQEDGKKSVNWDVFYIGDRPRTIGEMVQFFNRKQQDIGTARPRKPETASSGSRSDSTATMLTNAPTRQNNFPVAGISLPGQYIGPTTKPIAPIGRLDTPYGLEFPQRIEDPITRANERFENIAVSDIVNKARSQQPTISDSGGAARARQALQQVIAEASTPPAPIAPKNKPITPVQEPTRGGVRIPSAPVVSSPATAPSTPAVPYVPQGVLNTMSPEQLQALIAERQQMYGMPAPTYAEGGFVGPNGVPIRPAGMQTQTAPMAAGQPTSEELDASINETLQNNPQVVEQIRQVIMEAMQSGELTPQELNTLGQMAQASLQDPSLYPQLRQMAIREGLVEEEDLPTQYEPAIISLMLVAVRSMGQAPSAGAPQQTPQMQPAGITPTAQMPSMAMGGPVPASMSRSGAVPILAHEGEFVVPKHIVDEKGREFFTNMLKKYSPEGQTKNASRG